MPSPRLHILVTEDDPALVRLYQTLLERDGYRVTVAVDAMQGGIAIRRQTPDLVLLDMNMPAGGGTKVLQTLRVSAQTANVPVVVVTADTSSKLRYETEKHGVSRYLQKPLDPSVLLATIRDVLREHGHDI